MLACALLLASLPLSDPISDLPDTLYRLRGKELSGIILRTDPDQNTVWFAQATKVKEYSLDSIRGLSGPRVVYPEFAKRLHRLFGSTAEAKDALQLAKWCEENGLLRDLKFLRLWALVLDPANQEAHQALGHKMVNGRWMVRFGNGGRSDWPSYLTRHLQDDDPWEVRTSHFFLRAAGPLGDVIQACADLEATYAAFFRFFQNRIGFFEVREEIPVYVYSSRSAFPPLSNNLDTYFHEETRSVRSYFSDGRPVNLYHETTHALVYFTTRELSRRDPDTPGWLDEGLAQYMANSLFGRPGAPDFQPGRIDAILFRAHARAKEPDGMQRVLNYQSGDFGASTNQTLHYAESYTLLHFLLHGGDEEQQGKTFAFLHSAWLGKNSPSHFKKIFGLRRLDRLEELWQTYVQENAPEQR